MPKYYTPLQTAALLGLSKNTMYKHIKDGTIRSVRLGEGRIRIPASELKNLIDITEEIAEQSEAADHAQMAASPSEPAYVPPTLIQPPQAQITQEEMMQEEIAPDADNVFAGIDIYDWFVGIGAVMVSLALFLFDYRGINLAVGPVETILWWVRIWLFAWGWGHIIVSLLLSKESIVKRVSFLSGGLLYAVMVGVFMYGGTTVGISLYIAMSLGLLVSAALPLDPIKRYLVHVGILVIASCLLYVVVPNQSTQFWEKLPGTMTQMRVVAGIMGVLLAFSWGLMLLFQRRVRSLFILGSFILVAIGLIGAYTYALFGYWDRVMLLLVCVVFGSLYPFYEQLNWGGGDRRVLIAECVGVIGIMVVVVSIVAGLMSNLRYAYVDTAAATLTQEIKNEVDREVERAQSRLKAAAGSRLLWSALVSDDRVVEREYLREMVRGSSLFKQVLLFDTQGSVRSYYPETNPAIIATHVGFDEYYRQALRGESYISPMLSQTQVEGAPWTIVISVPVVDESGYVVGVLAGRFNTDLLNEIVGTQVASGQGVAYLLDKGGRVIAATSGVETQTSESIGSIPANPQLGLGAVSPTIAQVEVAEGTTGRSAQVLDTTTNCCGWRVVFEKSNVAVVETFEYVGLILVLGVMILVAVGVAVLSHMGRAEAHDVLLKGSTP